MGNRRKRKQRRLEQRRNIKEQRSIEHDSQASVDIDSSNKYIRNLAIGVFALVSLVMASDRDSYNSKKKSENIKDVPASSSQINGLNNILVTKSGEAKFKPIPGLLASESPSETCSSIDRAKFLKSGIGEKFNQVLRGCEGNLQFGNNTHLKCTIPGFRINGRLFMILERLFLMTGAVDRNTLKFARRTFVFHREDGKDGLPLEPKSKFEATFTPQAKTQAEARVSHSLSSVPLSGDKLDDVTALATEICQTLVIPKYPKDALKSEIICNSFGMTVKCAYSGMSYGEYQALLSRTAFMLKEEGGKKLYFKPLSRQIYRLLQVAFRDKPDVLERK